MNKFEEMTEDICEAFEEHLRWRAAPKAVIADSRTFDWFRGN